MGRMVRHTPRAILFKTEQETAGRPYGACCVMVIAVPVIVNVDVRWGPVFGATVNWTTPSPTPDAPWVTVRNAALLTAVHAQLEPRTEMEIDADPPAAENVVVVFPVMIWHPPGDVEESPPWQASAPRSSAADKLTRARRE